MGFLRNFWRGLLGSATNRSSHYQTPIQKRVHVSWRSRNGEGMIVNGTLRNISGRGVAIESTDPLSVKTFVVVHIDDKAIPAVVRYCKGGGDHYTIGLEFNDVSP